MVRKLLIAPTLTLSVVGKVATKPVVATGGIDVSARNISCGGDRAN